MSFSIQTSKGFMPVNCNDCGSYFWMDAQKAQRMTAAGKRTCCRPCQLIKGYEVPAWPCARRLDDAELTELEMETARNSLAYEVTPPPVEPAEPVPTKDTLTLAELRDRLKYYLGVTRTKKTAFSIASGLNQPSLYGFLSGNSLQNKNRFKIEEEMRKRNWLIDPTPTVTAAVPVKAEELARPETEAEEPKAAVPLPYPEVSGLEIENRDGRHFHKYLANIMTMALADRPDHPNRDEIEQKIREHRRIADMTDEYFSAHERWESNPINKLDREEKLHCIRTLPLHIVNKLFPHL